MDAANAIMHGTLTCMAWALAELGLGWFGLASHREHVRSIDLIDPLIVAALVWPTDAAV
jgi:hypothetical protein